MLEIVLRNHTKSNVMLERSHGRAKVPMLLKNVNAHGREVTTCIQACRSPGEGGTV